MQLLSSILKNLNHIIKCEFVGNKIYISMEGSVYKMCKHIKDSDSTGDRWIYRRRRVQILIVFFISPIYDQDYKKILCVKFEAD